MEKIKDFLSVKPGCESDDGYACGSGYASGYGYASGDGYGDGSDDCDGDGSGSDSGDGDGYGDGSGQGDGSGYGYGDDFGIKSINGETIYMIDCVPTVIDHVEGNIAKGRILKDDFTFEPCYVVKQDGYFAHGETLHDAMEELRDKLLEDMPD